MPVRLLCLLLTLLSFPNLLAGQDPLPPGARAAGLGFAYTGVKGDFWGLFHNPAGLAGLPQMQAAVTLEQRYLLPELAYAGAGFALPFTSNQTAGLRVATFGFDAYRESRAGLSYAIEVLERIRMGVTAEYAGLAIAGYGSESVFLLHPGLQVEVTEQLNFGFRAYNVTRAQLPLRTGDEPLPSLVAAGLAFQPSEKVLLVADLVKDEAHPLSFRGGVEYQFVPALCARAGFSTEPLQFTGGLGLHFQQFRFDFSSSYTDRLGYTPYLALGYSFGS